jgi:hypothetical protein
MAKLKKLTHDQPRTVLLQNAKNIQEVLTEGCQKLDMLMETVNVRFQYPFLNHNQKTRL